MPRKYLIWRCLKKTSLCFNRSFICWAMLDIVENIVGNIVHQGPELILCTLTTLFNNVGEGPVPMLPLWQLLVCLDQGLSVKV